MDDPYKFDLLLERLIKVIKNKKGMKWEFGSYNAKTSFSFRKNFIQIELHETHGEMGGIYYCMECIINKKRLYISGSDSQKVEELCKYAGGLLALQREQEELARDKQRENEERTRKEAIERLDNILP